MARLSLQNLGLGIANAAQGVLQGQERADAELQQRRQQAVQSLLQGHGLAEEQADRARQMDQSLLPMMRDDASRQAVLTHLLGIKSPALDLNVPRQSVQGRDYDNSRFLRQGMGVQAPQPINTGGLKFTSPEALAKSKTVLEQIAEAKQGVTNPNHLKALGEMERRVSADPYNVDLDAISAGIDKVRQEGGDRTVAAQVKQQLEKMAGELAGYEKGQLTGIADAVARQYKQLIRKADYSTAAGVAQAQQLQERVSSFLSGVQPGLTIEQKGAEEARKSMEAQREETTALRKSTQARQDKDDALTADAKFRDDINQAVKSAREGIPSEAAREAVVGAIQQQRAHAKANAQYGLKPYFGDDYDLTPRTLAGKAETPDEAKSRVFGKVSPMLRDPKALKETRSELTKRLAPDVWVRLDEETRRDTVRGIQSISSALGEASPVTSNYKVSGLTPMEEWRQKDADRTFKQRGDHFKAQEANAAAKSGKEKGVTATSRFTQTSSYLRDQVADARARLKDAREAAFATDLLAKKTNPKVDTGHDFSALNLDKADKDLAKEEATGKGHIRDDPTMMELIRLKRNVNAAEAAWKKALAKGSTGLGEVGHKLTRQEYAAKMRGLGATPDEVRRGLNTVYGN